MVTIIIKNNNCPIIFFIKENKRGIPEPKNSNYNLL